MCRNDPNHEHALLVRMVTVVSMICYAQAESINQGERACLAPSLGDASSAASYQKC